MTWEILLVLAILAGAVALFISGVLPIVEEIERRTGRTVSRTAVYVTLTRLEKRGLVASRMGEPTPEHGGKAKRYFRVEPKAVERIKESRAALRQMWEGLEIIG